MASTLPPLGLASKLDAPAHWCVIEFASDLHLSPATPHTFAAWSRYLLGTDADAVLLLGDVFEVWVGDDAADAPGFEQDACDVLSDVAKQRWIGFMAGNRDFLVGDALLHRLGVHRLADPTCLRAFGRSLLLSHGDRLCIDDVDYQRFRVQVRSAAWQSDFLSRPLSERRELARRMRDASTASQRARTSHDPAHWADVDDAAALAWLRESTCPTLLHGHTHRPAAHALGHGFDRIVLSDWDLDHDGEKRADVIRWTARGLERRQWLG